MGQSPSLPAYSPSASLSTLERSADVEICSVMHFLSAPDIVRVARCSKRLLRVAASPFAFRFCEPVVVSYPPADASDWSWFAPAALLSWALSFIPRRRSATALPVPCGLRLTKNFMWLGPLDIAANPRSLCAPASVAAFIESKGILRSLESTSWIPLRPMGNQRLLLFHHPCMQQLQSFKLPPREVHVNAPVNDQLFRVLAALPQLHTLSLRLGPDAPGFAALATAPSLTRLDVDDAYRSAAKSRIPAIVMFPHVLHLSVLRPSLYGRSWDRFFSTPLVARLQSLELNQMSVLRNQEERGASDYSAISNLVALRQLRLRRIEDVEFLLPYLTSLPRLRMLLVDLRVDNSPDQPLMCIESVVLASLLQSTSSPDLRCVLRIRQLPHVGLPLADAETVLRMRAQFESFANASPEPIDCTRFSVEVTRVMDADDE